MKCRVLFLVAMLCSMQRGLMEARKGLAANPSELAAPAGILPVKINPAGETILPNGRLITPLGIRVVVAPHPYGLARSPDGKTLVTANSGTHPFSVSIITQLETAQPQVVQIPPGFKSQDADPESVYLGVAIAPDNRTLYLSEGNNGRVAAFDLITHQRVGSLSLDGEWQGKIYKHSLTGEVRLSPDGRRLYVLDLAHFRLAVFDTVSRQMLSSVSVGRMPFGLALSPDGRTAYVTNVGMFRYSLVPGYDPKRPRQTALDFPPFGFPSPEARDGTVVDGQKIPGLGDPNVLESNSLWVIDVSNPVEPRLRARLKTGLPVGEKSVGGSSPGAVVAGRKYIFVSNAAQDSITMVDARSNQVKETVVLEPAETMKGLRGVLPFGLALSPHENNLYVACAGINAVAVLETGKGQVLGYLPTAWFPVRVAISPDGRVLYVANAKGFGAGPNGGRNFRPGPEGTYIGDITKGVVSIIPLPSGTVHERSGAGSERGLSPTKPDSQVWLEASALALHTRRVLRNNGFIAAQPMAPRPGDYPVPPAGQISSKIKHLVFIVKENRTFDEVFGDLQLPDGTVERDASLARWGENAEVKEKGEPSLEHVQVTPNHHALARRFAISDNFYVDADVSADGHHWLVGNYPNEFIEAAWPAAYGGRLDFLPDEDVPGRLMLPNLSPQPESYLEAGSLWEQLTRHGVAFRNYGEGVDLPGVDMVTAGVQPTGVRVPTNVPMPKALFDNTSRAYPGFNMQISDQYRLGQFEAEFRARYLSGQQPLPQFLYIWLPNDHTDAPRPGDGYPYKASYVADNDLALGKLVELLSKSPFWKDMAILVTEDDAQDGRDHIDAHRSLLMVISPYARRGVSHGHTSMASILKTILLIFGLPSLNQYDAAASDLAEMFTDTPDFTPYAALPADKHIFDPAKVREPGLEIESRHSTPFDDPMTIRRDHREREQK